MKSRITKAKSATPTPAEIDVSIELEWVSSPPEPDPRAEYAAKHADEIATRWRELFEREVAARKAIGDNPEAAGWRERLRAWLGAAGDLMKDYEFQTTAGHRLEPEPTEIAGILGNLAKDLATGQVPDLVRFAAKEGRREPGPTEQREMQLAVAYREACRPEGLSHLDEPIRIADRHPVQTVSQWFDVTPRAVRNWLVRYPPASLGVSAVDASILVKLVKAAGASYRRRGRSAGAITRRASTGQKKSG